MPHPLEALLRPRSVAILGASPRADALGNRTVRNLIEFGFTGDIYPIHPTATEVCGIRAWRDLKSLPAPPDCAAVALSADKVLDSLEEAAACGVRGAVLFASGFAESGPEGRQRQAELAALTTRTGLAVCGPNCLGLANIGARTSLYSAALPESLGAGGVAIVSHSGSGCIVMTNLGRFGFSYVISAGNCAVLDMAEYLDFLAGDAATRVVALFMETVRDPGKFAAAARRVRAAGKHIVALKVGRTERGAEAAAAHTGSLAGSGAVYADFFARNGVTAVEDIDELAESVALMLGTTRRPQGRGLGIINVSGGEIALTCDLATTLGVELPALSAQASARVAAALPSFGHASNPLDATGTGVFDMEMYAACIEGLASDPGIALLAVSQDCPAGLGSAQAATYRRIAQTVARIAPTLGKPVLFYSNVAGGVHPAVAGPLLEAGVPVLQGARATLLAIRRLFDLTDLVDAPPVTLRPDPAWQARLASGAAFTEREAKQFLAAHGIAVTADRLARSCAEAVAAAQQIGFPVVLKIESADLPHKSDVGGVQLNLRDAQAVAAAYDAIMRSVARCAPQAAIGGISVQEMVSGGTEAILGLARHDPFGMAVVVGAGGVLVELLADTALALAPLDSGRAASLIGQTRLGRLLDGYRGAPPGDRAALAEMMVRLAEIGTVYADNLAAIDLNPVHVGQAGAGVRVLDALVVPRAGGMQ